MTAAPAQHAALMKWFAERHIAHVDHFSKTAQALGVTTAGGDLVATVIYDNWRGGDIEISIAAEPGHYWMTPSNLRLFFGYPFIQLGCRRVTCIIPKRLKKIRRLCQRLGFTEEGVAREGFEDDDAVIYGLLRRDCKWIGERDGQKLTAATAAT